MFGRKLSSKMINEKLAKYVETFVVCQTCGKPETKLLDEGGKTVKKCLACGEKSTVTAKI